MATNLELRAAQKKLLFALLELRETNRGASINRLDAMITEAEAVMDAEDAAYVKQLISQQYP